MMHIQKCKELEQDTFTAYSGIFRTLCNARILRTLRFSEPCHIQNIGIGIFRPKAYSVSCLGRHIQAFSGIFNHECYNNINFLISTSLSKEI